MKKIWLSLVVAIFALSSFAQDKTLLTIGDKKIGKNEFVKIYTKNNSKDVSTDVKSVDEYLELFINFKLKVVEAESQGLDTVASYVKELQKYTQQLAKPHFTSPEMEEKLLREAYERTKKEVRVSYIFVQVPAKATPADTLKSYNKIIDARKRILNGENFENVALEVSEARNVKQDKGDAWYMKAFGAPYEIENFAYNAKIGDVSIPIRQKAGYFIIKKTEEREAVGEINASHIMVSLAKGASKEDSLAAVEKLDEIKKLLAEGTSFEDLAKKYSDDKGSGAKGGELGWFGTGRMVRPFEQAAFALENKGDISEPVRTIFGWHIIKLNDKKGIGTYEELKEDLNKKLQKDPRKNLIEKSVYEQIKKEGNYKKYSGLENFYAKTDSTIFEGNWSCPELQKSSAKLFELGGKTYTEKDFANYLASGKSKKRKQNIKLYIDREFEKFLKEKLDAFKIQNLQETDADFKYITTEYHDGLLLFEITDKEVWSKATKDTEGLEKFYKANKTKYYDKLNLAIYSYSDEKTLKKTKKIFKKKEKKNLTDSALVYKVDKKGEKLKLDESRVFKKGTNKTADKLFEQYEKNAVADNQIYFVDSENQKIIYIKNNFNYVKGLVTADYQQKLEKEWIEKLKTKHKVEINQSVLDEIKSELK